MVPLALVLAFVTALARDRQYAVRQVDSFAIAEVFLGGRNRKELLAKTAEAERLLGFELCPLEQTGVA